MNIARKNLRKRLRRRYRDTSAHYFGFEYLNRRDRRERAAANEFLTEKRELCKVAAD